LKPLEVRSHTKVRGHGSHVRQGDERRAAAPLLPQRHVLRAGQLHQVAGILCGQDDRGHRVIRRTVSVVPFTFVARSWARSSHPVTPDNSPTPCSAPSPPTTRAGADSCQFERPPDCCSPGPVEFHGWLDRGILDIASLAAGDAVSHWRWAFDDRAQPDRGRPKTKRSKRWPTTRSGRLCRCPISFEF
jgi:hypothetical protein